MASRLGAVFGQEFGHALKRPLFWTLIVIMGLTAWGLSTGGLSIQSGDSQVGGTKAWVTSQFAVSQMFAFVILLFYAFFIAIATGMTVITDEDLKVSPLLHSTPLRAGEYVWGKFFALLMGFVVVLLAHLVLTAFFNHVVPSGEHADVRGPFVLTNYLIPALVFGLPTIIFIAGVAFAVGAWTRKPILVFVLPVALVLVLGFFLWDWSPSWLDPRMNRLFQFLDPAGFRWLNETWLRVDRGVAFYNHKPVGYDLLFLANRLADIAVGLGAVWLSQRGLERAVRGAESARNRARASEALTAAPVAAPLAAARTLELSALGQVTRPPGFLAGTLHVLRVEFAELWSQPGLYIFVPLILMQTLGNTLTGLGAFETPLLFTSGILAVRSMGVLTTLVCLLILFYTVESLDRERRSGLAGIFNATPLRTSSILLGKAAANAAVGGVILLSALFACLIAFAIQHRVAFDIMPFFYLWGLVLLPTFLAWSAFVAMVQGITGNRYFTYAAGLAVMIFTAYRSITNKINWVGNWGLWRSARWSDISFFEMDRWALVLNRVFVLALAAVFCVLAVKLYGRRSPDAIHLSDRLRPRALLLGAWRLLPVLTPALVAGIALYAMVFSGTGGPVAEKRAKDYWKKNMGTWHEAPLPSIAAADLDVDLFPERSAFSMKGSYVLKNRRDVPLDAFPMTAGDHFDSLHWTLNGAKYVPENRAGLYVFKPARRMMPGDSVRVGFDYHGKYPKGVTKNGGGAMEFIMPSSVVMTAFEPSFAPIVGYIEERGMVRDAKYEPRVYTDSFYLGQTPPAYGYDVFPVRMRATGPAGWTINGVGELVSDSTRGGRHVVVWQSDQPVSFFNVVAGHWKVKQGHGTEIYYAPQHPYNIEEMSEALDAARKYYSEWFYPFPWKTLKLSEFAGYAGYAQGFPTNITFSENIGFLTKSDPRANAAFLVTAHESAHQWWGNMILPGRGPGGDILSEGMSHFSTILLFGQVKGLRQRIEVCKRLEVSYNRARRPDSERPMVKIDGSKNGDQTVTYDKGGWVFWMMLNQMGRERMLAGLQGFQRKYHDNLDHPVLQDFTAFMRGYSADTAAYDAFVKQWFFDVVIPEYKLEGAKRVAGSDKGAWTATVKVTNAGSGRVAFDVAAIAGDRFLGDKDGYSPPAGLSEKAAAATRDEANPAYREARVPIELKAGESKVVRIPCGFKPEKVTVDPDAVVLMLNRKNAEVKL